MMDYFCRKNNLEPAIGLFSGAGIGDKGFEAAGYQFLLQSELKEDRAALIKTNFPNSDIITGDIVTYEQEIIRKTREILKGKELFAMIATPPCQGMSPNGMGTLLDNVRKGLRPKLDPRNQLILPALRIAAKLKPLWVIFENVSRMKNTLISDENGEVRAIIDLIPEYLGEEYIGEAKVVEFADYGIPQRRQRLITIYTRLPQAKQLLKLGGSLIPAPTHDKLGKHGLRKWVTLKDAIGNFPPLDGENAITAKHPSLSLHYVPVLDPKKYEWIRHTPENESAFNNQCINPNCQFNKNPIHGASRNASGINRANTDTPLYCIKCGHLLPRPYTCEKNGTIRIMRGYTSAYKRMSWHLPAPTLTKNLSFPCSDQNIHPSQNRVLSLAEACQLQTISDFDYHWGSLVLKGRTLERASDSLIRDAIGESIPPKFMYLLGKYIRDISQGNMTIDNNNPRQLELKLFG